jgi:predicted NBD/HSP70 family sugar kinase
MYLLFDIGGTKTRIAFSKNGKKLDKIKIFPTIQNFKKAMVFMEKIGQEISGGKKIKMAAGGSLGVFNKDKSKLLKAGNIKDWEGKPLKEELQKIFKCPVYIENDADLGGLGEAVYGLKKKKGIVAFLTISTGVGGTKIVDGEVDANVWGFEPGKHIINFDSDNLKELEDNISGKNITQRYGKEAGQIKSKKFWNKIAYILAVGVHNTIIYWSPDAVILGGSVMKSISMKILNVYLQKIMRNYMLIPEIKKAKLGDYSGLYGALVLLKNKIK